ncbi:hypothetical protein T484DRAFT_1767132 [Baffinella frigidus]|nr:hypothetical protein T484DRAFT_1767132 [Cryptophyta sp. CCMP2293]
MHASLLGWALVFILWPPPAASLDNQVFGFGLMTDLEHDEFYTDRVMKATYQMGMPVEMKKLIGMPVEMKKLIVNSGNFHRQTTNHLAVQDEEDARQLEKESRLPDQAIPRKIWQVCWETPTPRVVQAYTNTWKTLNDEYVHTICNTEQAEGIVKEFYPEVLHPPP